MKKLLVFSVLILLAAGSLFAQIKKGETVWISSKSADLKASTGFFANTTGSLRMGDKVTVLQINGNWAEVRSVANASQSGWTAVSNLSSRQIVSSGTGASASEVALAGKGFNQEVENSYKANGNLDYTDVDKTEAIKVSRDDLYKFVTDGHLVTGE